MAQPSALGSTGSPWYASDPHRLHIRNTFIEFDAPQRAASPQMRRSQSDSDVSAKSQATDSEGNHPQPSNRALAAGLGDRIEFSSTSTSDSFQSNGAGLRRLAMQGRSMGKCDAESTNEDSAPESDHDALFEAGQPPASTSMRPGADSTSDLAELLEEFERLVETGAVPQSKVDALRDLLPLVPRDPATGASTSTGSINHPLDCRPCVVWFKGLCQKGISCNFCHFVHVGQRRQRVRLKKHGKPPKAVASSDVAGLGQPRGSDSESRTSIALGQPASSSTPSARSKVCL